MSATISAFPAERVRFVDDLLGYMTLPEKLGQLIVLSYPAADASANFLQKVRTAGAGTVATPPDREEARNLQALAVEQTRLGIPLLFLDDLDALDLADMPEPIAIAASWDEEAASRAAIPAAYESRRKGISWLRIRPRTAGRTPGSDRASESYGSDPFLAARMGVARIKGLQGASLAADTSVLALVDEGSRGRIGRELSDRILRDPAMCSRSGASLRSHAHRMYDGIDLSEWRAIHAAIGPADGTDGLARAAQDAISEGRLASSRIDDAVRKLLLIKHDLGLFRDPFAKLAADDADGDAARSLREEIAVDSARRSMVLLRNDRNILPLSPDSGEILVVGSQDGAARSVSHGLDQFGLLYRQAPGLSRQRNERDPSALTDADALAIAIASDAAKRSRTVLLALGREDFTPRSQALPVLGPAARALFTALAAANSRLAVIISTPWPVDLGNDAPHADALLLAWERSSGIATALGEILSGEFNPTGRLPIALPGGDAEVEFPFGHGLSYSRFTYSNFVAELEPDGFSVEADIANRSEFRGTETVQLYIGSSAARQGTIRLRGFRRVTLGPDESQRVRFGLGRDELGELAEGGRVVVNPGRYEIRLGPNAAQTMSGRIEIGQPLAKSITLRDQASVATPFGRAATAS